MLCIRPVLVVPPPPPLAKAYINNALFISEIETAVPLDTTEFVKKVGLVGTLKFNPALSPKHQFVPRWANPCKDGKQTIADNIKYLSLLFIYLRI
ncbi:MAG: hypothetical protein BWY67_02191 [Bacteroidetes bacterium ADurb.Bin397]|nr:MAG: hypothetical protein BWY67_02191 [Bacteroidetes bacterium ADurb.Bin397]